MLCNAFAHASVCTLLRHAAAYVIAVVKPGETFDADEPCRPTLTTTSGVRVPDNQNSIPAGPRGPALLDAFVLIEKLATRNPKRVPERTRERAPMRMENFWSLVWR
jgi:Catalase